LLLIIVHLRTANVNAIGAVRIVFDLNQAWPLFDQGLIQVNAAQPSRPTLPGCCSH